MPRNTPLTRLAPLFALVTAATLTVAGCSLSGDDSADATQVVVGYQSKTINTVTAGTLLRARGDLEKRLDEVTEKTGKHYKVRWEDYDTGAPITTGMIAGKIDIGSMGDYPLLINGSRADANPATATSVLAVTGSSPRGSLNMVVAKPDSPITSIRDLAGKRVSASVGSAGHGTLLAGLKQAGIDATDVDITNQQPQVGSSALEAGKVDALAQFVAWPGLLVFQNKARLVYDGAQLGVPTLHGTIARNAFTKGHPEVIDAFLKAQLDATKALAADPLAASQTVAKASGLPAEVVYLYNGPGGTDFNPALKPSLIAALNGDKAYLKSIGSFPNPVDLSTFVNDGPLRTAVTETGGDYTALLNRAGGQSGSDSVSGEASGEVWYTGTETKKVSDATALLRLVQSARASGAKITAAYITDPVLGTRWFADHSIWLHDGATYQAFTTDDSARTYQRSHPGAVVVSYDQALTEVKQ
ncbi:ABC transporter substrate-binding protein [Gordonia sp. TBRC 11910]|uniref:ABC transporter substrate-binding protein n=1 Tax=Gordonia asplenii TaxID=2725283 RepID=A0A848L0L6_9ACTN|nr:ABC transporter substrate-binding protein [Gordonia asplenii]NMO04444.1 ABC transporter substrate-binding protein [Gordonia asplenii]